MTDNANTHSAKLIMRWDVVPDTESEYFEFLVHELIPAMGEAGMEDIQVWYTAYGECEQKMAEGTAVSSDDLNHFLASEDWDTLLEKLFGFVENFDQKVIRATRGFQI